MNLLGILGISSSLIFLIVLIVVIALIGTNLVSIVPQANAYVIERLGAYHETWNTGLHVKIPFIDRIANKVTLKEIVQDFQPQPVITKDNVTMQIDTVVYMEITDPKLYTYGVINPMSAVENLTATTLRNIIGDMDLDMTLTGRDAINTQIRSVIDEATDKWGIKVTRVEVKNIIPPKDIREAMEKQMRAERERREKILQAEGEKKAAILKAEGNKEAMILQATGEKESMIAKAEGEAESMKRLYEAQANGIRMIKEAQPSAEYLALKGFESYEKMAEGAATKIVVPTSMQDMAATLTNVKEMLKEK
jgi:regulator of protease activity HflC (stomatin/prohibitin superfamily)